MLGKQIRNARIHAGLTQESLAAKAKISREYVNFIENGKRQPTVVVFIKLCNAMDVYPPDLLKRIVDK